jgi:hypothetical protein
MALKGLQFGTSNFPLFVWFSIGSIRQCISHSICTTVTLEFRTLLAPHRLYTQSCWSPRCIAPLENRTRDMLFGHCNRLVVCGFGGCTYCSRKWMNPNNLLQNGFHSILTSQYKCQSNYCRKPKSYQYLPALSRNSNQKMKMILLLEKNSKYRQQDIRKWIKTVLWL